MNRKPNRLPVAFLWHFHQPDYRDPSTGVFMLPWVRLHACHSYTDMIELTLMNPSAAWMLNFTPVLLDQLHDYADGKARDHFHDLSIRSPDELDKNERLFILENFFLVNQQTQVFSSNRFTELYMRRKRLSVRLPETELVRQFSDRDIRDIQVWFNLAWMGWWARRDDIIINLLKKGTDYSEENKKLLFEVQAELVGTVLKKIARIPVETSSELTFTPFYHPILPLICDTETARKTQHDLPLPRARFRQPREAEWHIMEGLSKFEEFTGVRPEGMWPSEGSVSHEVVDLVSQAGIKWLVTDQKIRERSTPPASSKFDIHLPYRMSGDSEGVCLFFRHSQLSDDIGFKYQGIQPDIAAREITGKLERIASDDAINRDHIVTIALDGENPWGYYPDRGERFLENLVGNLNNNPVLEMSTVSGYLTREHSFGMIESLHSGSWIDADFHIWIGDKQKNRAWDMLHAAMDYYQEIRDSLSTEIIASIEKHLHAAQGSDWFWWFGEPNHSANDAVFDRLFRDHLREVYRLTRGDLPDYLTW